jgi:hypothetical protein
LPHDIVGLSLPQQRKQSDKDNCALFTKVIYAHQLDSAAKKAVSAKMPAKKAPTKKAPRKSVAVPAPVAAVESGAELTT